MRKETRLQWIVMNDSPPAHKTERQSLNVRVRNVFVKRKTDSNNFLIIDIERTQCPVVIMYVSTINVYATVISLFVSGRNNTVVIIIIIIIIIIILIIINKS